jgi:hypothetical protein
MKVVFVDLEDIGFKELKLEASIIDKVLGCNSFESTLF